MSVWARAALLIFGVLLLLPGACSAFFLVASPGILFQSVSVFWYLGAGLGALGVFLIVKGFSR
jgi:hypothetical protein